MSNEAKEPEPELPAEAQPGRQAGIDAWHARALAGVKRLHEQRMRDEPAYRRAYQADYS